MRNVGDLVSQCVLIVFLDVDTVHKHFALACIVKTGHQVDDGTRVSVTKLLRIENSDGFYKFVGNCALSGLLVSVTSSPVMKRSSPPSLYLILHKKSALLFEELTFSVIYTGFLYIGGDCAARTRDLLRVKQAL